MYSSAIASWYTPGAPAWSSPQVSTCWYARHVTAIQAPYRIWPVTDPKRTSVVPDALRNLM